MGSGEVEGAEGGGAGRTKRDIQVAVIIEA
jgi:hypothetical protein